MSFQTRYFGDETFNAIGYGCAGLSIAYGSIGTDEERLKVVDLYTVHRRDNRLILIRTTGSGCRLRVRVYLLGHCRCLWGQRGFDCKMVRTRLS